MQPAAAGLTKHRRRPNHVSHVQLFAVCAALFLENDAVVLEAAAPLSHVLHTRLLTDTYAAALTTRFAGRCLGALEAAGCFAVAAHRVAVPIQQHNVV